jgi:cyclic pyranopterin phosphate synthase
MTFEEQKRSISLFAKLGVNKLRFTGGEPTINKRLPDLVKHSTMESGIVSVGITTNGLLLRNQLDRLIDAGLSSVNISLDTLQPEKFAEITRRESKGLYKVLSAIYDASSRKELKVKINCVLMRSRNDEELVDFVKMVKDAEVDVRFIEMMPFDGNSWESKKVLGYVEVIEKLRSQVRSCVHSVVTGYLLVSLFIS